MAVPKSGPLTRDELLDVWKAALDKGYRDPMLAAGEGQGLEAHTQMHAALARASEAVDRTTQAMFICPWSGQTNLPAGGGQAATVTLSFARTKLVDKPLILGAGLVFVEEVQVDSSELGPVSVPTGRRYVLSEDLVFHAGDVGPFDVPAVAEVVGYGHNNPMPGTIRLIAQPGSGFENDLATVTTTGPLAPGPGTPAQAVVVTPNEPDTFVPEHVGQAVIFTAGANVGKVGRVVVFQGPDLTVVPAIGSRAQVELHQTFEASVFAGTFTPREIVNFGVAARGFILGERIVGGKKRVTYVLTHATAASDPAVGAVATGVTSGATATIQSMLFPQRYTAEAPIGGVGGASWRILDWAVDWGLTATNVEAPSGGVHAWLDELGGERNLARAPGEPDDVYRQRVKAVADVVSPNAIRRALSRALGTIPWCFREVGTAEFPGFFYDGDGSPFHTVPGGALNDAYDTDVILFTGVLTSGAFLADERVVLEELPGFLVKADGYFGRIDGGVTFTFIRLHGSAPASLVGHRLRGLTSGAIFTPASSSVPASVNARRFRFWLDYSEFRGFFMVGVPRLSLGEFGFAYDAGPTNAYDAYPFSAFYDGFAAGSAAIYSRAFQSVEQTRAGGVLWALYREDVGCP